MTALAIPAVDLETSTSATMFVTTTELMRHVVALHGTTTRAPEAMLDALRERGMGELARVLDRRNARL